MIKAIFMDFYGTVVFEDGEVIEVITKEILDTGKADNTFRKEYKQLAIYWRYWMHYHKLMLT